MAQRTSLQENMRRNVDSRTSSNASSEEIGSGLAPQKIAHILAASSDIQIIIDSVGMIKAVSAEPQLTDVLKTGDWSGSDLRESLTVESITKLESLLDHLANENPDATRSLELNHLIGGKSDCPIRYVAMRTGDDEELILIGQNLTTVADMQQQLVKAQQALDKDYEKYRYVDTRYRAIMDASTEPLVFAESASGKIIDLNDAAAKLFAGTREGLIGSSFGQQFSDMQRQEFFSGLDRDRAAHASSPVDTTTLRTNRAVRIYPTSMRAAGERLVLCRIELLDDQARSTMDAALHGLFEAGSDAIVLADARGSINSANDAFLSLCDISDDKDVNGKSFAEFLGRGGIDLKVLLENASRNGRMRLYATKLASRFGGQISVEIATTRLADTPDSGFAFVIRDTSRLEGMRETSAPVTDEAMRNVMELVGSAPLRDIVAATTDVVERMCIETAVELTQNNRVAAAEMLGLSRQSLYVKLRKFNLQNKNAMPD